MKLYTIYTLNRYNRNTKANLLFSYYTNDDLILYVSAY